MIALYPLRSCWRALRAIGEYRQVRRYLYAIAEVGGIALISFAASVVLWDRSYRIGIGDPGMAKITGLCFMFVGIGLVALSFCAKTMDAKIEGVIIRLVNIESVINVK